MPMISLQTTHPILCRLLLLTHTFKIASADRTAFLGQCICCAVSQKKYHKPKNVRIIVWWPGHLGEQPLINLGELIGLYLCQVRAQGSTPACLLFTIPTSVITREDHQAYLLIEIIMHLFPGFSMCFCLPLLLGVQNNCWYLPLVPLSPV